MASRTIESDRDRKMTIITTTFIPCGAKLPVIALIGGALFGGAWWVAPSAYFAGMAAIVFSGIILKKTTLFSGNPAPFVMELPAYHLPTVSAVLHSMWERGWSFVRKAGTIILVSAVFVWFLSSFGIAGGGIAMVDDIGDGFLASIGKSVAWIFAPLGFGEWKATMAVFTGLVAKENVVGTLGVLYGFAEVSENGSEIWRTLAGSFTPLTAYSFLIFNLLCAPCFAAVGAIRREMNNAKWTLFAIGYQTGFAYLAALCIYQFGMLFSVGRFGPGTVAAFAAAAAFLILLLRPRGEPLLKSRLSVR
jgi:ferrous iron transport protein B